MDFIMRIFKGWETRDSLRRWVNTYEIVTDGITPQEMLPVARSIGAAEKLIHLPSVQFLSLTVSTWSQDSEPYNPESFVTEAMTGVGTRAIGSNQALDTNVSLFVQRNAVNGRQGKLFYRGVLHENDVESGSDGFFKLSSGSTVNQAGADFQAYLTAMNPFLAINNPNQLTLISSYSPGPSPIYRRRVTGLTSAGVVINRRNHRYFDVVG